MDNKKIGVPIFVLVTQKTGTKHYYCGYCFGRLEKLKSKWWWFSKPKYKSTIYPMILGNFKYACKLAFEDEAKELCLELNLHSLGKFSVEEHHY